MLTYFDVILNKNNSQPMNSIEMNHPIITNESSTLVDLYALVNDLWLNFRMQEHL